MNAEPTNTEVERRGAFAPGFAVRLAQGVVWKGDERALFGGAPPRRAVFSGSGARIVEAFIAGAASDDVEERGAASRLLRYLLDKGLVEPIADRLPSGPASEIIIPALNRARQVAPLVSELATSRKVVVVDDCSTDDTSDVARAAGAKVISLTRSGGPAAARNVGLHHTCGEIVAFIDSDCVIAADTLQRLERQFADPAVGAVAPRVAMAGSAAETPVGKYEEANGSEDLGPLSGLVGFRQRVPYVPTIALLVRRSALQSVGGFREAMRFGEDVDLVWRLVEKGWLVRYVAEERVGHDHRRSLGAWLVRKFFYGSAAADIDLRHPGSLSGPSIGIAALIVMLFSTLCLPGGAVVLTAGLVNRQSEDGRISMVASFAASAEALLSAAIRLWLPLVLLLTAWQPLNGAIMLVLATWRYSTHHRRAESRLSLPTYVAVRFLDEAFYCAGVWAGCFRLRNFRPLLPRMRLARRRARRG